jgi:hypothetical protein
VHVSQLPIRIPSFFAPFYPPDARCEVRAEQAIVGSLVGQAADSRQPQVDGCRGEPPGQVIAVSQNDPATERQSGFGAVPGDEVVYDEGIGTFRGDRAKALQNRSLGVIKIRQAQHALWRAALGSRFLWHGRGLPEPPHDDHQVDGKVPGIPFFGMLPFNKVVTSLQEGHRGSGRAATCIA